MNTAVPGNHPDQDLLDDLLAEALPADKIRAIEAHVMSCPSCERRLADAERARAQLTASDPGPLPPSRVTSPPAMSFDEAPTAAWKAFLTEEPADAPPASPVPQRVGRAVRSMRSRRDVRAESGDQRRPRRPWIIVGVAAASVTVLAVGGYGVASLVDDRPVASAASEVPSLGTGTQNILHASGAEYTASTLASQTRALVQTGSPVAGERTSPAPADAAIPRKPGTVTDPEQLSQCLRALGESDPHPLAVDLASYQGREAAVIVLPGATGGFNVWVVARDCRPGAEGPLAYKSINR